MDRWTNRIMTIPNMILMVVLGIVAFLIILAGISSTGMDKWIANQWPKGIETTKTITMGPLQTVADAVGWGFAQIPVCINDHGGGCKGGTTTMQAPRPPGSGQQYPGSGQQQNPGSGQQQNPGSGQQQNPPPALPSPSPARQAELLMGQATPIWQRGIPFDIQGADGSTTKGACSYANEALVMSSANAAAKKMVEDCVTLASYLGQLQDAEARSDVQAIRDTATKIKAMTPMPDMQPKIDWATAWQGWQKDLEWATKWNAIVQDGEASGAYTDGNVTEFTKVVKKYRQFQIVTAKGRVGGMSEDDNTPFQVEIKPPISIEKSSPAKMLMWINKKWIMTYAKDTNTGKWYTMP